MKDNKEHTDKTENTENIENAEDKAAETEAAQAVVSFSGAFAGYKKSEVDEYIALLNTNLANAQRVFDQQSEEYKENLTFLNREKQTLEENLALLEEQAGKALAEAEENKEALAAAADLKKENEELRRQVNSLFSKLELCKNLVTENRELKEKVAEVEVFKKHSLEEKEIMAAEVEKLREENTKLTYDFAQEKKELEAQYLNANLQRAEHLHLHNYHVNKTDELLEEALKQFKLALKSLEDIENT
ncbi:MAG: hypothetical protein GX345_03890 [Clostridiales bacterium]|nr:hypothetical protein [Clostridiales bacterium]